MIMFNFLILTLSFFMLFSLLILPTLRMKKDNTVSVIDINKKKLSKQLRLGKDPEALLCQKMVS